MISIVIVTYNAFEYVRLCLESIRNSDLRHIAHEVIVVDNNSTEEGMRLWLAGQDVKLILNDENVLLTRAQEQGLSQIDERSKYVLFLNSDFEFTKINWATIMLKAIHGERVAIVGQQENRNLRTWEANIDMCHFMIKRDILDEIGGFQDWFPPWNGVGYILCRLVEKYGYRYKKCRNVGIHHKGKSRIFNPVKNEKLEVVI